MKKLLILTMLNLLLLPLFAANAFVEQRQGKHIADGFSFVVAVQWDGTVRVAGSNESGQCNTASWRKVTAVDAGAKHSLGLKEDGTVYAAGSNEYGQCSVHDWKDIVMVAAGYYASYGLKKDGTVVTTSKDDTRANRDIAAWRDSVWIDEIWGYVYAIDKNGTGYGAGLDDIEIQDALQIDVTPEGIYVLKKDGTVECDINYSDPPAFTDLSEEDWQDVAAIDCSGPDAVGLARDGTVIDDLLSPRHYDRWSDIAEMRDGFGITADGLVVFAEFCTLPVKAWEEICSWKVMVDPQRAKALGARSPSQNKAGTDSGLILAENGMRLYGQTIEFTEGSKYAVYTGPGNNTLRGGDGRALVSTSGPIQVYGVENGWALICYDIAKGKQRFGYIPALTLPKAFADSKRFMLMNLAAQAEIAMVQEDTFLTDDPLGERTFLCALNAGQKDVLYLGTLNGDWAYVQTVNQEGIPLRGFAPIGTLFRMTGARKDAVTVPEGTDMVWTNASEEHHYYDTQDDYFVVPDDARAVIIPDSMTDVKQFENLLWLKHLTDMEVSKDHPAFQSMDGVLYSKDGSILCFYPPGRPGNELILPEGTKEIDNDSGLGFADKLTSIVLPSTYTERGPYIPTLVKYIVTEGNPVYQAIDGVLFSKDGLELIAYPMARPGDDYTVPQGTESIGDYAFSHINQIRHVVLPEGLNTIGWLAFEYCESLESVVFPNTLSFIDEGAFIGCTSLTHVQLPSSLRTIAHGAFAWSGLTGELRIPEGVESIDAMAIEAIPISDLYLPASLTEWELQFDPAEERKRDELNGWRSLVVHAPKGSWAAEYAAQQGFLVEIEEP